jgi:exodeoxyribonuclease VII small subunit
MFEDLTFEKAIEQLTDIVKGIEQGTTPLQQSLDQYEKGMALINHCRHILKDAEKKIEKISQPKNDDD